MGAGLIGVWYADLRPRQLRELSLLGQSIRAIAVLYEGNMTLQLLQAKNCVSYRLPSSSLHDPRMRRLGSPKRCSMWERA
jgi:hypothetical protein